MKYSRSSLNGYTKNKAVSFGRALQTCDFSPHAEEDTVLIRDHLSPHMTIFKPPPCRTKERDWLIPTNKQEGGEKRQGFKTGFCGKRKRKFTRTL